MTARRALGWAAWSLFWVWLVNDIVHTHSPEGQRELEEDERALERERSGRAS
jgi:hypothetical protein